MLCFQVPLASHGKSRHVIYILPACMAARPRTLPPAERLPLTEPLPPPGTPIPKWHHTVAMHDGGTAADYCLLPCALLGATAGRCYCSALAHSHERLRACRALWGESPPHLCQLSSTAAMP